MIKFNCKQNAFHTNSILCGWHKVFQIVYFCTWTGPFVNMGSNCSPGGMKKQIWSLGIKQQTHYSELTSFSISNVWLVMTFPLSRKSWPAFIGDWLAWEHSQLMQLTWVFQAINAGLGYIMIGFYVNYGKLPFVTHFEWGCDKWEMFSPLVRLKFGSVLTCLLT